MRIVDAHFHVWRQADLPWLQGPTQPRIFGPYDAIKRDYSMAEYRADITGTGVEATVYVQANWPPERAEAEVDWVASVAAETGWPHAIVAYADLTVRDASPALDALARRPLVRGIRQQLHWHENPTYRFAAGPDLARDPQLQRNVARLAEYGFAFDLQVFPGQMQGAAELAAAAPGTTLVLQHAGMLEDLSHEGRAFWRENLARLAARPNVVAKLSGFGTFIHANEPAHVAWMVRETLALFGPERCLFGSNFPIEKLWTTYAELIAAFRAAADHLPDAAQHAIFETTAGRVYRL